MKIYIPILTIFLFVSCSGKPEANNAAAENRQAKNKQIAVTNEVSALTRLAQNLEKQGRGMEIYRQANNAENKRECNAAMEDGQKQIQDFEARTNNLPDNFKTQLTPILADLKECVSCSKNAMDACVKSRATINKVIKELFPQ